MDPGSVMGFVMYSITAVVMLIIGVAQYRKKDEPVGFYNVIDPPKKEAVSDILTWNKKHGMLWILFGLTIEMCAVLGIFIFKQQEVIADLLLIGSICIPLPIMAGMHRRYVKKYGGW